MPEPRIAQRLRRDRNQLAVEPGRGLGTNQLVERLWGQHVDGDRAILRPRRFIGGGAIEMIGRDDPGAVRFALDIRSEEHTSELQSLMRISYAVFCLKKK